MPECHLGIDVLTRIYCRQAKDYLDKIFNSRDAEMELMLLGLCFGSWVTGSATQALTEDRFGQLMSQYCYFIRNSSWYVFLALDYTI
jgi:hypothetical protein